VARVQGDTLGQGRETAKRFLIDNPDLAAEIRQARLLESKDE